eukprot:COSAG06_NODE_6715_length_2812_cov_706.046812_1_plen_174_part_10
MPKTAASSAVVAGSAQPQACKKKQNQRVSIFNPFTNKMARVSPYSAKAKKLYRYYIEELDYDPAWVAPKDLKFYEDSGRFRRVKSKPEPKPPEIFSSSSYKSYLSCHTLNNIEKVMGYAGLDLFTRFRAVMLAAVQKHGGLKVYPTARCVMVKKLEGKVIEESDEFFVSAKITT